MKRFVTLSMSMPLLFALAMFAQTTSTPSSTPSTTDQGAMTGNTASQSSTSNGTSMGGSTVAPSTSEDQKSPDNTKINQRDRSQQEVTADQQKEVKSDRELARQIRRSIVKDKSLSTYAHNVKVIAQNGGITLKGPVRSDEEKQAVEAKATQIAGADKVKSEIQVNSKNGDKPSANRFKN